MDADREAHVTDAWLQRAVTLLGRGDGSGAVEAMREVLGRDPDDAHAHAILALALVVARRLHAAEHEARLALQLAPDTAIAHRAMGEVCLARRKLAAAQEHLEAARARNPDDPAVPRRLATVHDLAGRGDRVLPLLEEALALDPMTPTRWWRSATITSRLGIWPGPRRWRAPSWQRSPSTRMRWC